MRGGPCGPAPPGPCSRGSVRGCGGFKAKQCISDGLRDVCDALSGDLHPRNRPSSRKSSHRGKGLRSSLPCCLGGSVASVVASGWLGEEISLEDVGARLHRDAIPLPETGPAGASDSGFGAFAGRTAITTSA